jgi:hypothetical protein
MLSIYETLDSTPSTKNPVCFTYLSKLQQVSEIGFPERILFSKQLSHNM